MGNSASNANQNHHRTLSRSPAPGVPHRSLKSRKKSLELPDLVSLTPVVPPKSASIPIPIAANDNRQPRAPPSLPSTDDLLPHHTAPYYRPTPYNARQAQAQQRIQELYNQSQQLPPPPPSPSLQPHQPPFHQETVRSTIPILLAKEDPANQSADDAFLQQPVTVTISWTGGGKIVQLARAGDDDWKGRQLMERESPTSQTFTAEVSLLPGTHHIRFLVDDQWRVAEDLPTAVDDQGSLANYVAVSLTYSPPPPPPQPTHLVPGQSFWSAASSTDDDISSAPQPASPHKNGIHHKPPAHWTSELPPELIAAAREEEAYLQASAGQLDAATSTNVVAGFVPAPNIPPAPGLPRHLDKLILNTRVTPAPPASSSPGKSSNGGGRRDRDREREREKEKEKREEKERGSRGRGRWEREREREREKDRDRERQRRTGLIPPPPSEDGTGEGLNERPEPSPVRLGADTGSSVTPSIVSTAPTTPTPSTPLPSSLPTTTKPAPPLAVQILSSSVSSSNAATPSSTTTSTAITTPSTSAPTLTPSTSNALQTTSPTMNISPTNSTNATATQTRALGLGLDTANMPPLTDDASVLPVPSHVVLHHLSTSAIRGGMLAVGSTIRYRKKYLTTIYYKPT